MPYTLQTLPADMFNEISGKLDDSSWANLSFTCKRFKKIFEEKIYPILEKHSFFRYVDDIEQEFLDSSLVHDYSGFIKGFDHFDTFEIEYKKSGTKCIDAVKKSYTYNQGRSKFKVNVKGDEFHGTCDTEFLPQVGSQTLIHKNKLNFYKGKLHGKQYIHKESMSTGNYWDKVKICINFKHGIPHGKFSKRWVAGIGKKEPNDNWSIATGYYVDGKLCGKRKRKSSEYTYVMDYKDNKIEGNVLLIRDQKLERQGFQKDGIFYGKYIDNWGKENIYYKGILL